MCVCFALKQLALLASVLGVFLIAKCHGFPTDGLIYEPCRTDDNCRGDRVCVSGAGAGDRSEPCTEQLTNCFCSRSALPECSNSDECSDGERCFKHDFPDENISFNICLSCRIQEFEGVTHVDEQPATCNERWLGNYTGDLCSVVLSKCEGNRSCRQFLPGGKETDICSYGTEFCYCLPERDEFTRCSSSAVCEDGERCATGAEFDENICISCGRVEEDDNIIPVDSVVVCNTPAPGERVTTSPTPSPSVSMARDANVSPTPLPSFVPTIPRPCVAINHLSTLHPSELVYSTHIRASVLCDSSNSCATPGHIVVYQRTAMMMASYCSLPFVTCVKRVSLVNNMRMRRAFRLSSLTDGLQFTAFSARYGSTLEETLLRTIVHLGF